MEIDAFKGISCKDLEVTFIGEDGKKYTYKVPKCNFKCDKDISYNYHMPITNFLSHVTMTIDIDARDCDDKDGVLFTLEVEDKS